jgi:prophage antirepressor-like protein
MSLTERALTFEHHQVSTVLCKGQVYWKASDVTSALEYANGRQALRAHVKPKHAKTLRQLREEASGNTSAGGCLTDTAGCSTATVRNASTADFSTAVYVSEPGLYTLIMHSRKPSAERFQDWVCEEVLPEIMRTGTHAQHKQLVLQNERDLHYKVIDFIRKKFPEAILVAGLGELQDSDSKRIDAWRKGYTKGQSDITILNRTSKTAGLVIEFKTPKNERKPSPEQEAFLQKLRLSNFQTLISNDYDDIVEIILEYRNATRRTGASKQMRLL